MEIVQKTTTTFEKKVRYLLIKKQIELKKLAEVIGTSSNNLLYLFKNPNSKSSFTPKIADFFGVSLDYLKDDTIEVNAILETLPIKEEAVQSSTLDIWRDVLVQKLENQIKELQEKEHQAQEKELFYMRTIDSLNETLKKR